MGASEHPSLLEYLLHGLSHDCWRLHNCGADRFEGLDLIRRSPFATRNDGSCVAHSSPGGSSQASNEGDHRLVGSRGPDELSGVFLCASTNLSDHDDTFRLWILHKPLQAVDEVRAVEWISPNTDDSGLPEPFVGRLKHRFVCQCSRPGDNADLAGCVDVARHDSYLTLAWLDDPWAVGSDELGFALLHEGPLHLHHVVLWDAFGDANHKF
mmetsp:Transcript_3056/g.7478  ORF Transcript_3056/g.7478 Transcript_3056/m.7478 type:complete len:211 (+) Transcript_3056:133-765(+)